MNWKILKAIYKNTRGIIELQHSINSLAIASVPKFIYNQGQDECEALNIMYRLKLELEYENKQLWDGL